MKSRGSSARLLCGGFRGDVALRHSQHFESDHKFPSRLLTAGVGDKSARGNATPGAAFHPCRLLMETHRVRKADRKQVVVSRRDLLQDVRQASRLLRRKGVEGLDVITTEQECFKRPNRPETAPRRQSCRFRRRCAASVRHFGLQVVAEQAANGAQRGNAIVAKIPGRARRVHAQSPRSGREDEDYSPPSWRRGSRISVRSQRPQAGCPVRGSAHAQASTTRSISAALHACQSQTVVGMEAEYATGAALTLRVRSKWIWRGSSGGAGESG